MRQTPQSLYKYWPAYFMFLIKVLANRILASFKVLKRININKCKPTVFSLLFLHYEWHHITLGCWVMIREQWCWFDELCMKGLLSTLPSLGKARLLKAILMCAFVRPLCGPFLTFQTSQIQNPLHRAAFCLCQSLVPEDVTHWFRHVVQCFLCVCLLVFVCLFYMQEAVNWHLCN